MIGLVSAMALAGCWTDETPTPPPVKTGQVEPDDGAADDGAEADEGADDGAADEGAADEGADDGAADEGAGAVTWGTGTGLSSGGDAGAPAAGTASGTTKSPGTGTRSATTSGTSGTASTATGTRSATTGTRSSTGSLSRTGTTGSNRAATTGGTADAGTSTGTSTASRTGTNRAATTTTTTPRTSTGTTGTEASALAERSTTPAAGTSSGTGGTRSATTSSTADTETDAVAMVTPAVDIGDFEAAPGVRRFSGADWKSLREERVLTVMNEPGPGTDPSCYPRDMLPLAEKGKLTKDQTACVQKSLSQAEYAADQARLSLVLIANSYAREESDNWSWLVQRHLEVIDDENPGLAYRYAMFLYEKGPGSYPEALRWADVALGQRAAWTGAVYHERVTRLYKLRAAATQALWRAAEEEWAAGQTDESKEAVLDWRDDTRKAAIDWYRYADETGMETETPYKLCVNASIEEGCDGIDKPQN